MACGRSTLGDGDMMGSAEPGPWRASALACWHQSGIAHAYDLPPSHTVAIATRPVGGRSASAGPPVWSKHSQLASSCELVQDILR